MDVQSYILSKFPEAQFNNTGRMHTTCPFHDDATRSFSLNTEGLFICGSTRCGVRGNFFLLYKMLEGIKHWRDVYEQLKTNKPKISTTLEEMLGVKENKKKQLVINDFPIEPFVESIHFVPYLNDRGISNDVIEIFGVSYGVGGKFSGVDVRNSLVAPVYDIDGTYMTFQVRRLGEGDSKRWYNPPGSCSQYLLYGGWLINGDHKHLWIVEGASDVWKLRTYGIQSVGLFTKEASVRQTNTITKLCKTCKLKPVVCLDGDAHGRGTDYNKRIAHELYAYGLQAKIIYLREKEDPGSLTIERINEIQQELGGNNGHQFSGMYGGLHT